MADFYAIQDLNKFDRKYSTSGGFISLLANKLLLCGYNVYGASFDETMALRHTSVKTSDDVKKTCGSKYVQSSMGNTFHNIKNDLKNGNKVLFIGTPCQIAGISSFLLNSSIDCNNLILVELKCYGVPSPGLFRKFINFLEEKYKSKVVDVRFRDKEYGYSTTVVKVVFDNKKELINHYYAKSFSKTFFSGNNIRPSCYRCCFRDYLCSNADFIVGDFHSISKYDDKMDDDLGTSFVVTLTKKGTECLKMIESNAKILHLYGYTEALPGNPNSPNTRSKFFKDSEYMSWNDLIKKHCPKSIKDDMAFVLKPIIYKSRFNKFLFSIIKKLNNYKYKLKTRN